MFVQYRYYRSVLDTGNNVEANNTLAVTNLCNAATMAAKALYMLAAGTAGTQAGSLEANCTLVCTAEPILSRLRSFLLDWLLV